MEGIIEIEGGVLDQCPQCGCAKFMGIEVCGNNELGRREHRSGLKCWDCGTIFIAKK